MKRLILLVALVVTMAVLAPAAFADDLEGADIEMEEKDLSAAQERKAQMIADYFTDVRGVDITKGDVSALRAGGDDGHTIGWGVLYKLMLYAGPDGFDPATEGGWAIGQLRKSYLADIVDGSDDSVKNLGQLQKASKDKPQKPEKVMPDKARKDKNNG